MLGKSRSEPVVAARIECGGKLAIFTRGVRQAVKQDERSRCATSVYEDD
jgi:hypothetical protein